MSISTKILLNVQIIRANFVPSVPRWNYSHASTPTWRLYWNPAPGAWIKCKNNYIPLDKDIIVLVPPQFAFATGSEKEFPHFYVHFTISGSYHSSARKIWQFNTSDILSDALQKRIPLLDAQELLWAGTASVHSALLQLPQNIFTPKNITEELSLFEKACNVLEELDSYNITCSNLAAKCSTKVNTLQREFYKATGLPIQKWLLNRRMEKATHLLLQEKNTIKETASFLGFADRYHFSKVFKNYFGTTPAQFVKQGGLPLP